MDAATKHYPRFMFACSIASGLGGIAGILVWLGITPEYFKMLEVGREGWPWLLAACILVSLSLGLSLYSVHLSRLQLNARQVQDGREPLSAAGNRFGVPAVTQKQPSNVILTLGLRLMLRECKSLLKSYRRLNHEAPEATKRPLHSSLWPDYNPPTTWSYTQIRLCCLRERLMNLQTQIMHSWEELKWTERTELFHVNEATIMPDLLAGTRNPPPPKSRVN